MRDIRALFTTEYLDSRVFNDVDEQTVNSEVKIIENRTQPRKKNVEESTPDSVLYIWLIRDKTKNYKNIKHRTFTMSDRQIQINLKQE